MEKVLVILLLTCSVKQPQKPFKTLLLFAKAHNNQMGKNLLLQEVNFTE